MDAAQTPPLKVRPATAGDCSLLFGWANDPVVRRAAFSMEPIPWASHQRWFAARLAAGASRIFIAQDSSGVPVGQIRFDPAHANELEVDVTVGPEHRGRGLGAAVIAAGVEALLHCVRRRSLWP